MKDAKVPTRGQTKGVKLVEKTGKGHRINHSTPTWTTGVSTVEANNSVISTGTNFQYSPHFQQPSTQQHSHQSQSTVGSSTPMLMVNNLQYQQGLQGQPQRQPDQLVQQVNQQVRPPTPQTFNQQYNQYRVPQASPLLAQPHNPQIPPPYPGQ